MSYSFRFLKLKRPIIFGGQSSVKDSLRVNLLCEVAVMAVMVLLAVVLVEMVVMATMKMNYDDDVEDGEGGLLRWSASIDLDLFLVFDKSKNRIFVFSFSSSIIHLYHQQISTEDLTILPPQTTHINADSKYVPNTILGYIFRPTSNNSNF